jgi:hypothetical protein
MESLHVLCRSAITRSNGMKSCSFKIFGYLEKRALIKDSLLHVIFISITRGSFIANQCTQRLDWSILCPRILYINIDPSSARVHKIYVLSKENL